MANEIVTVERCRHCGCEWVCPDCGGVAGAQPPAETPIETCACGTVWPANRLPACADLSTTGKACDTAARAYDAAKGDARAEARATWDAACQAYTDARRKLEALGVTL